MKYVKCYVYVITCVWECFLWYALLVEIECIESVDSELEKPASAKPWLILQNWRQVCIKEKEAIWC